MQPKDSFYNRCAKWLDCGVRWLFAGIFLYAGFPKLIDPVLFAKVIAAYGLLPKVLLLPTAILLPLTELLAALLLFMNKKAGLWLTAGLMAIFIGVLSYGIHLGLDIDCGCFSPEDPEHTAFSGLRSARVRDFWLLVPLGYGFWYSLSKLSQQNGEHR